MEGSLLGLHEKTGNAELGSVTQYRHAEDAAHSVARASIFPFYEKHIINVLQIAASTSNALAVAGLEILFDSSCVDR